MQLKRVGSRGELFTFYDLGIATNVYVIYGERYVYIIDTYLGPDSMKGIKQHIKSSQGNKPIIIVNSHSHWDHVWGNCLFDASIVIGHKKCKEFMQSEGLAALEKHGEYKKGDIILKYPNLTFNDKLCFEEDGILIYHTPGHSEDSISVLDMRDRVLFAGDNLERPIPYLMAKDLGRYIDTLKDYLEADAEIIIGGHTACEGKDLISDNLSYVIKVLAGDKIEIDSKELEEYHKTNMNWLSK